MSTIYIDHKCQRKDWMTNALCLFRVDTEKREASFLHSPWECKLVKPLRRTVWRFLEKLKVELPVIPLWADNPEKNRVQKSTCTPLLIAALFTTAKTGNQPKCPLTEAWIKICYFMQCDITQPQKEWNYAIWRNMNGPGNYYTNCSKSEKDKNHMIFFMCGT